MPAACHRVTWLLLVADLPYTSALSTRIVYALLLDVKGGGWGNGLDATWGNGLDAMGNASFKRDLV